MTEEEVLTLQPGDVVRCTADCCDEFSTGTCYVIGGEFWCKSYTRIAVEEDDRGEANGWDAEFFELVSKKAGPW